MKSGIKLFDIISVAVVTILLVVTMNATAFAADVPDSNLTPGATRQVTLEELCTPGSSKVARNVPLSVRHQVFANYGMSGNGDGYCSEGCEVDHFIPLETGGSNDINNLWPMAYHGDWNAHMKDALENKLHSMVCSGKVTLEYAQEVIRSDWKWGYRTFVEKK